jgi:hypothetical protein
MFGLSRFGLSTFSLSRFGLSRFDLSRFGHGFGIKIYMNVKIARHFCARLKRPLNSMSYST